jgi:hypothetical protein
MYIYRYGLATAIITTASLWYGLALNQTLAQEAQTSGHVEKPDETLPVDFEIIPSSILTTSQVNFTEEGILSSTSGNLAVTVRLKLRSTNFVHEISNLQIIHAITDTQEKLLNNPQYGRSTQPLWSLWNNGIFESRSSRSRDLHISLNFMSPRKQISKLVEVSGTFDVVMPVGEPLEAILSPFSDYEGRRLTFKEFPDAYVQIQSRTGREIGWGMDQKVTRIQLSRNLVPHLASMSLQNAHGESVLPNTSSSYGMHRDYAYRMFQMEMPANGQVRLLLYPKIRMQTISFTLRNVPLIMQSDANQGQEMVVELKPFVPGGDSRFEIIKPQNE